MDAAAVGAAQVYSLILPPFLYRRRPAAVVCAKPRRRRVREPRPYEYQEEEEEEAAGVVGLAALATIRSDTPQDQRDSPTARPLESPEAGGGPLRGSDVLRALQRAAAKKDKKRRPPARRAKSGEKPLAGGFDDVRPIEIKGDWLSRIEELERRVRLLLEHQHL